MSKKYKLAILFLLSFSLLVSCKKFVEIPPPSTELLSSGVFVNQSAATAAQTQIYTTMESLSESYNAAAQEGLLADELTNYSTDIPFREFYSNSMKSVDILQPWTSGYNYIYQANAVISGLENYSGISASVGAQLKGEALLSRAFWYFYLTNCYGAIPLPTTTNYAANALLSRTPQTQVYQQVVSDLKTAQNLLSTNYVDASDTTATTDRIRPNKYAASALLARTYLFAGSYDSAAQQATLVINNSAVYQLTGLDSVFLANSTEAIWQIPPVQPTSNPATSDGQEFILLAAPQSAGSQGATNNCTTISPQLMSAFETGDNRMTHWISFFNDGTTNWYFPYKYKVYDASSYSNIPEYTMVLRLAEQYLIRAEAYAQQGNLGSAVADLNTIRNRAGLVNYSGSMDKASILTTILHERQVELFTEWGHRWFDLQRTGNINTVMSVVTPQKGGSWNPSWALYPIPLTEINIDRNLTQNPNY